MDQPKKILVIRLSSIGDIILTSPILRTLRNHFPESQIHFIVKKSFAVLIKNNPALSKIYEVDPETGWQGLRKIAHQVRQEKYDLLIDLHKNYRSIYLRRMSGAKKILKTRKYSWKRLMLIYFRKNLFTGVQAISQRYLSALLPLGIQETNYRSELFLGTDSIPIAQKRFRDHHLERSWVVGICPGAGFWNKRWLSSGFAGVAKQLIRNQDARIILFGNKNDLEKCDEIQKSIPSPVFNWCGQLELEEFAACLSQCSLVISNDSGAMHVASALNRKVVAIFGATSQELGFFPQSPFARVVENTNLDCRPCTHVGRNDCPRGHFKCMNDISPEMVIRSVETLLK